MANVLPISNSDVRNTVMMAMITRNIDPKIKDTYLFSIRLGVSMIRYHRTSRINRPCHRAELDLPVRPHYY